MNKPTGYLGKAWCDMSKEELIDIILSLHERYENKCKELCDAKMDVMEIGAKYAILSNSIRVQSK